MVYVIQEKEAPHRVKIGFSKDADKRIAVLAATLPQQLLVLRIDNGDIEDERFYHEHLKEYRVEGTREWYYPYSELFDFLNINNGVLVSGF